MDAKEIQLMRISKTQRSKENLITNVTTVEQVETYAQLSTMINSTTTTPQEIKIQIETARANFNKILRVLCT